MPNPRAIVAYDGIGETVVTFKRKTSSTGAIDYLPSSSNPYPAATSTQIGQSANMDANDTIRVGAAGAGLIGKLIDSMADGTCTVQTKGFMTFTHLNDANKPVLNRGVVCDGSGGIRIAGAGSEYLERGRVVYVDTTTATVEL